MQRLDLRLEHIQPGRQLGMYVAHAATAVEGVPIAALGEDRDRLSGGFLEAFRPALGVEVAGQSDGSPRAVKVEEELAGAGFVP